MKQVPRIVRKCEYIPNTYYDKIIELVKSSGGKPKVRHDNYLAIVSTIYFKCINEQGYAHVPHPIAKNYWLKTVGGRYKEYINELLEVKLIDRVKKGGRWNYHISFNMVLKLNKLIRVDYKTDKITSTIEERGISTYEVDRIENRLGRRILKHLGHVSVDYEAFEVALRNGRLNVDPKKFEIDISEFPPNMDFDGEVHYLNDVRHHNYRVKTLLKKAKELNHSIFHDKDRIKIMNPEVFAMTKTNGFTNHAKLNLNKTKDGNFELSRDEAKTRRVFHTCVFLPSKTLPFIRIDNEPVVGIDAKTSQFLLLANLFNSFEESGDQLSKNFIGMRRSFVKELYQVYQSINVSSSDVQKFFNDVVHDDFYEVVRKELKLSQRSQAKIFCFSIIFSKPDSNNAFKEQIRNRYPTIIDTLDGYKRQRMDKLRKEKGKKLSAKNGYQMLSINLQALESEIFIEGIFHQLHKEKIYCFTRHDSVVVGQNNQDKAYKIANDYYTKLGFTPKFEIEPYNTMFTEEISYLPTEWLFLEDIRIRQKILTNYKKMTSTYYSTIQSNT
jgi:hypothetical protein